MEIELFFYLIGLAFTAGRFTAIAAKQGYKSKYTLSYPIAMIIACVFWPVWLGFAGVSER